jgi:hypothetical protein
VHHCNDLTVLFLLPGSSINVYQVSESVVDGQQRLSERLLLLVQSLRQRVLELVRGPLQRAHRRALRLRERPQLRRKRADQIGRPEVVDPEEEALRGPSTPASCARRCSRTRRRPTCAHSWTPISRTTMRCSASSPWRRGGTRS